MAKNVDVDSPKTAKTGGDAEFRAVVKRLLDTPPMHKTSKPARPARRSATPEKKPR